jgi:hypothetical protein
MKTILAFFIFIQFFPIFAWTQERENSGKGRLSGEVFWDFYQYIDHELAAEQNENGFVLRRGTLTYDHRLNATFQTRIRLEADQTGAASGSRVLLFAKDAYLQWNNLFGAGHSALFGISPTPSFQFSEGVWGYRNLEKTILDFRGMVSSRDIGIDLKGPLLNGLQYWIKAGNNSIDGARTSIRLYGTLSYAFGSGGLITLSSDWYRGEVKGGDGSTQKGNRFTSAFFVGFVSAEQYAAGMEVVTRTYERAVPITPSRLRDLKGQGLSLFGWVSVAPDLRGVVRYDYFRPDLEVVDGEIHYVLCGLDFRTDASVSVIPNIVLQENGLAPGSVVQARLTFHYTY